MLFFRLLKNMCFAMQHIVLGVAVHHRCKAGQLP